MLQTLNAVRVATVLALSVLMLGSCDYREYADADYPEQVIYLPAANHNVYEISKASNSKPNAHPTPGDRYRYRIDGDAGKFVIPLSIYRAGVTNKGTFDVEVFSRPDTLTSMLDAGTLDASVHILNDSYFSLPDIVTVEDGETHGFFDVEVDLAFLQERRLNAPTEKFAIAVAIESGARAVNPKLSTVLIVINTNAVAP